MSLILDGNGSISGIDEGIAISGVTTITGDIHLTENMDHVGDEDTRIRFPAADTFSIETAGSEALRVDSSQRVGIGTNSPDEELHVYGSGFTVVKIETERTTPTQSAGQYQFDALGSEVGSLSCTVGGDVRIKTGGSTEQVRVTAGGSMGVGTNDPLVSLDVSQKTDAVALPVGTTAQRPTGAEGYIRFNSGSKALEIYNGTNWVELVSDYFPEGSTILG